MSVWAGRCPSCGARLPQAGSTRRPPSPPPAHRPGRARRRLDGWVLVVPLLAAGLLIGLTVWVRAHAGPTGPARPPASTIPSAALGADLSHRILVEGDQARLRFFHLDGTAEADVTVPPTTEAPRPLAVGTALVFTAARQARVIADPPAGAVRALGPADRLIRAVNPGQLWLVRDQDQAPATVQLACVPGPGVACSAFPAPRQVPAGMRPVASLAGGLLLVAARPDVMAPAEMWDPFADRVVFRFPAAFGDVIDTHLNVVVWRSGGPGVCTGGVQCPLHITDVGSGQDQLIPAPPGSSGYMGGGALSPDGSYLAAFAAVPDEDSRARPVIIRLGPQPDVQAVAAVVAVGEPFGAAVWDPVTQVVFVSGLSGSILACRPDNPLPTVLPVPASYAFTVL